MDLKLPDDTRQFGIRHLLWMTITFAVAGAVYSFDPHGGVSAGLVLAGFWIGWGLLVLSDTIDVSPVDERGWTSATLNVVGVLMIAVSLIWSVKVVLLFFEAFAQGN